MKIKKITHKGIVPVTTVLHKNFHNVRHGTRGKNLWAYSISISSKLLNAVVEPESAVLDKDNYVLLPILNNKTHLQDGMGNYMYFLSESDRDYDKNDFIILWEIPNKMFTAVKYSIGPNVELLGEGINGEGRHGKQYTSPAPVLEIRGPTVLKWTGKDKDGHWVSQDIKFNGSNDWTIDPLVIQKDNE